MLDRRTALKGVTLGVGAVALSPFLKHLTMLQAAEGQQLPKRLVFVVKSSGLQGEFAHAGNATGAAEGASSAVVGS